MRSRPAGPRSRYSRPGWATCSTNFFQPATEPFALEIAMTMPVRAALYLRVSTGRQAENDLSIPDQRRQAKRSEEHTSELQSLRHLVCRLLLEKKKKTNKDSMRGHII